MRLFTSLALALVLIPSAAEAHISLTSPPPRYKDQKAGPCGKGANDARSGTVTKYKPGATIDVVWKETIGHPGHFRIAFDPDGTSLFKDPTSFTDVAMTPGVLVNNIADKSGTQTYTQKVTLPNVECNNCTLQVIQVMTDKAPYGNGDDIYYQCADIVLAQDALDDAGVFPVADAGSSGSSGSSGQPDDDAGVRNDDAGIGDPNADGSGGCSVGGNGGSGVALAGLAGAMVAIAAARSRRGGRRAVLVAVTRER